MGNDPFVDAAESASFPLPGIGKREGGEKRQPLLRFPSNLGRTSFLWGETVWGSNLMRGQNCNTTASVRAAAMPEWREETDNEIVG